MDALQTALFQAAKAVEFGGRLVLRLAQTGEWTALLVLLLSIYALYFFTARLARTAVWLLKWTVLLFVVLSAVGWADSTFSGGRRTPGSRGVSWWENEGAKGMPSGQAAPWQHLSSSRQRRPSDDSIAGWADFAKSAGGAAARQSFNAMYAYAQHGLGALDAWSSDGVKKVGDAVYDNLPPEQRDKLKRKAKQARKRRW